MPQMNALQRSQACSLQMVVPMYAQLRCNFDLHVVRCQARCSPSLPQQTRELQLGVVYRCQAASKWPCRRPQLDCPPPELL